MADGADDPRRESSRETRLLLLTIAVSAAVLLLLARFRFPEAERVERTAAAPAPALERLAARATYDELAAIVVDVQRRIGPRLMVLHVEPGQEPDGHPRPPDLRTDADGVRFAPAVRLSDQTAVALLGPGARVTSLVGGEATPVAVAASDPVGGLALLRIPAAAQGAAELRIAETVDTPAYVALVEGTRGGPVVRPVFFGRTDAVADPRWPGLLLVGGGTLGTQSGALVFTLDGRFAGIAVVADRSFGLVPARAVLAAAAGLGAAAPDGGYLGIEVQDLTAALAAATGAPHGAVVTYVDAGGPAARDVRVGDVVESFAGEPVFAAGELRVRAARAAADQEVALRVWRRGRPLDLRLRAGRRGRLRDSPAPLGLVLRDVAGVGSEVMRVVPSGAGAAARLMPGDVVTHLDGDPAPSASAITRAFDALAEGRSVTLGVRRGLERSVVALEKR